MNNDLISRMEKKAILFLTNSGWLVNHDKELREKWERPQGKWIEKYSDYGVYYRCSICHKMPPNYECDYKEGAIKTNFCPNCGADMHKPNCVTCEHFGKCEGCEKGEEE